jgi:hypothetical protein
MKIAYLITAYKDKKNLRRLITSLNINADFFVHVDSKVDISPFVEELADFDNVKFLSKRYFINWGGFNQVLSQKELLKSAIESTIQYDRVACISGTDYPLWPNLRIANEFELNKNREYIMGMNITRSKTYSQAQKITLYHFFRDIKIKNTAIKKAFSGTTRILLRLLPFRKKPVTEIDSKPADIYVGSDYWCITFDCAKYVYKTMCTEKKLMKYFKSSFVPSEMVIQTIIFNSEFSKNAILAPGEYKGLSNLTPLHYIEYGDSIKIFEEADYDTLLMSDKMFFRKASSGISDKLLDKVDRYRK